MAVKQKLSAVEPAIRDDMQIVYVHSKLDASMKPKWDDISCNFTGVVVVFSLRR